MSRGVSRQSLQIRRVRRRQDSLGPVSRLYPHGKHAHLLPTESWKYGCCNENLAPESD